MTSELIEIASNDIVSVELTAKEKGVMYVLSNPAYKDGITKIGQTSVYNGPGRIKNLYSTGVPMAFKVEYAVTVGTVADSKQLESLVFDAFKEVRKNPKREFFWVDPSRAISQIDACIFHYPDSEDVTDHLQGKFDTGDVVLVDDDDDDGETSSSRNMIDFVDLNIPIGETLVYVHNPEITAIIVARRKLEYAGDVWSPSLLTGHIYNKNVDGKSYLSAQKHWTYKDELLETIYNRVHNGESNDENAQTSLF